MSEPVITVRPDDESQEAARLMVENKVGCLPVVKDERLLGILTETDVLRWVANGRSGPSDD